MNTAMDEFKDLLLGLPPEERAELAHSLLSTLGPNEDGVEAEWDAEASRGAEEIQSGRAGGRPADELLADLRERYP